MVRMLSSKSDTVGHAVYSSGNSTFLDNRKVDRQQEIVIMFVCFRSSLD